MPRLALVWDAAPEPEAPPPLQARFPSLTGALAAKGTQLLESTLLLHCSCGDSELPADLP